MPASSARGCAALLLAACTSLALAAPPAPQATARAGGIKQLRFDWNAVPGATRYELWFKNNASGTPVRYFQVPASQRSVINNVSVHLLDWPNVRYWVNACDSSGCTSSSQLSVNNLMLDTIGLFTPPSQQASSQFGSAVAISRTV
jgi:trimeric autotransporter adhesin